MTAEQSGRLLRSVGVLIDPPSVTNIRNALANRNVTEHEPNIRNAGSSEVRSASLTSADSGEIAFLLPRRPAFTANSALFQRMFYPLVTVFRPRREWLDSSCREHVAPGMARFEALL